jgi:hypothetical protein
MRTQLHAFFSAAPLAAIPLGVALAYLFVWQDPHRLVCARSGGSHAIGGYRTRAGSLGGKEKAEMKGRPADRIRC